jgi:DNA polymerase-3 subunit epsilon
VCGDGGAGREEGLSVEEAAGGSKLWRKLVKLFHPDRFAHEPDKQKIHHI